MSRHPLNLIPSIMERYEEHFLAPPIVVGENVLLDFAGGLGLRIFAQDAERVHFQWLWLEDAHTLRITRRLKNSLARQDQALTIPGSPLAEAASASLQDLLRILDAIFMNTAREQAGKVNP